MASIANGSQNVLQLLHEKVLERDIHLLWSEQKIDAGFVSSIIDAGFDLLEHNHVHAKVANFK